MTTESKEQPAITVTTDWSVCCGAQTSVGDDGWFCKACFSGLDFDDLMDRRTVEVEGVTFLAYEEQGAWYQVGAVDQVGALYMPMNADGTPDVADGPGEIEVTYDHA